MKPLERIFFMACVNEQKRVLDISKREFSVRNIGNIYSKPMIKFKASGEVNIYINEVHKLEVDLDETTEVTIDVVGMNATDAQGNYINRQVTGDYDKLTIPVGINEFRITGAVQEVEIANYSRWI